MNIKFEHGRNHEMDTVKTKDTKSQDVKKDAEPTEAELAKVAEKNKKAELKAVLTTAGVEVKGNPGIAKLEAMIAELPKTPDA